MKKGLSKYDGKFPVGSKFQNWIVVDDKAVFNSFTKCKEYVVKVKCICGFEKYISCRRLLNGETKGCVCQRQKQNSCYWKGIGEIPGAYFSQLESSAKKRNLKIDVSKKYLLNLFLSQNRKCKLSGLEIKFGSRKDKTTASLDRIDSGKGYTKGNLQWIHKDINIMKNVFSVDKFKNLCKLVIEHYD